MVVNGPTESRGAHYICANSYYYPQPESKSSQTVKVNFGKGHRQGGSGKYTQVKLM